MRDISQNLLARIYYYDESTKRDVEHELRIYYGNITRLDIANILNKYNIHKRGKQWSKDMIGRIIIDLKNNKNIKCLCEDGKYYDIEEEYQEEYDKGDDEIEDGEEEIDYELSDNDSDDESTEKITRMKIEMKKMQEELKKLKNKSLFQELRKRNPYYNYDNDSFDSEF